MEIAFVDEKARRILGLLRGLILHPDVVAEDLLLDWFELSGAHVESTSRLVLK